MDVIALQAAKAASTPRVKITAPTNAFARNGRGSAFAVGVDEVDNIGWFSTNSLFTSTDNLSLTTQASPPNSNTSSVARVVRFGSNVYCTAIDLTSGLTNVYKSQPPSAGTVAWSSVLVGAGTGGIGSALEKSTWASGTNYIYYADYGDPVGGPNLWRSSDGTTWTKTLGPVSGLRHIHTVAPDPYTPGLVFVCAGDGQSKVVYRSTDSGATWTLIITDNNLQAVGVSFTKQWIWFASDSANFTAWVMDRATLTPRIAGANYHGHIPVPGGIGARGPFADGAFNASSANLNSPTATFSQEDVGKFLRFDPPSGIDVTGGVFISAVVDSRNATMSKAAGGNRTGQKFYIDGDQFFRHAYWGIVDPATGIYYALAIDPTDGGNRTGLFYLPYVGGRFELLEALPTVTPGQLFIRAGKLWFHQGSFPLLTREGGTS